MAKFPEIAAVELKYRKFALLIALLLYVPIAIFVVSNFFDIWTTRVDPRTETQTVDGHTLTKQGISTWGSMGVIILEWDTPTFNTAVLDHSWPTFFDKLPDTPDPYVKVMPVPRASDLFPERTHRMVVINTSMLVPKFNGRTRHHVTPFYAVNLTFFGEPRFNLFTAPEGLTEDKLNTLAVEGQHYHDSPLTSRVQAFLSDKGVYSFFVQKEIVPRENHISWGLPWSPPSTRARYYATGPFAQATPNATSYHLVFVPTPMTVRHIVPLTIVGQASMTLVKVGSFMTLVHVAYHIGFQRKYPRTTAEKRSQELTLRGHSESNPLVKELLPEHTT